jgi:hypothetical protein
MRKFLSALSIGILAVRAVQNSSWAQGAASSKPNAPGAQFAANSPWADVDPIPLRGISPGLPNLSGKKIGLFVNLKRAAMPIAESIQRRFGGKPTENEPQQKSDDSGCRRSRLLYSLAARQKADNVREPVDVVGFFSCKRRIF